MQTAGWSCWRSSSTAGLIREEEREEIFRFRYQCYLGEKAILPNPEERFTDHYDDLGGTWLIGVYLEGRIVASMRICIATSEFPELPAMWAFRDEVQPLLDAGQIVIDPTRFTVDREVSREHPHLAYMTARIGWLAGEYFQANTILATQRREHQAFYRRVFHYKLLAEPRHYPTLIKPLGLMTLDYFAERDRVNNRYPFFRSTDFERRMMFERLQCRRTDASASAHSCAWSSRPTRRPPRPADRTAACVGAGALAGLEIASTRRRPGIATGGALSSTGACFRPIHLTCRFAAGRLE